jgi:hypothetical protein
LLSSFAVSTEATRQSTLARARAANRSVQRDMQIAEAETVAKHQH